MLDKALLDVLMHPLQWPSLPAWVLNTLSLAWLVYLLALGGWIVLQRRSPVSTLAWLLSLAWLPYIGFAVYYVFGPVKVKRQALRRQRSRDRIGPHDSHGPSMDDWPVALDEVARRTQALALPITGLPLMSAGEVKLLIDGGAKYGALLEAITAARTHVHLEYYILEPDAIGTALRDALAERARAGVKVRLLMDAVGSSKVGRNFLAPLTDAGGEVAWFHPFRFAVLKPMLNMRTHRKIAVIDGRLGFTGGINITDTEDERHNPKAFRDLHLRLTGPAVHGLQTVFLEDWLYARGKRLRRLPERVPEMSGLFPPLPAGPLPVQWLPSGPDTPWEPIHRAMLQAIGDARVRVWLVTPYFVPTEAALIALQSAALRGADVRVLVPRRADTLLVTLAARSYYQDLTAAGVRVYEYGPRMLHAKALLVDDAVSILGSANFDQRSFRLNFEICAVLYGPEPARALHDFIVHDMKLAREVPAQRRLRFADRLAESTARLFSPVL